MRQSQAHRRMGAVLGDESWANGFTLDLCSSAGIGLPRFDERAGVHVKYLGSLRYAAVRVSARGAQSWLGFFCGSVGPNLSLSPRKGSSSCYFLAEVCDPTVTSLTDKASCTLGCAQQVRGLSSHWCTRLSIHLSAGKLSSKTDGTG